MAIITLTQGVQTIVDDVTTNPWPQRCAWCGELSVWYERARDRVECRRKGCGWHDKQPRRRGIRGAPSREAETCESSP